MKKIFIFTLLLSVTVLYANASQKECEKFYGKKDFKIMQNIDKMLNDKGNALKKCQKDMDKKKHKK